MLDFQTFTRGPLFDRRLDAAVAQGKHEAQAEVARVGEQLVRSRLGDVLRHPTGYYRSHVRSNVSANNPNVTDSGVVYGPWLEGTSSRNRTTRFKGYFTFRLVRQQLEGRVERIAEPIIRRKLGGL